jgi:hypothetical protein
MRVMWTAAAALVALCVSGCDINTTPKSAKVECNCTTSPDGMRGSDADAPPPPPYRHRHDHGGYARYHDHYDHGGHGHYWRREYSEVSVFTYDYHSDSHGYTMGGGANGGAAAYAYAGASGGGAYAGAGASAGGGAVTGGGVWVDGHGRSHGGSATAGEPAHYEPPADDHARQKPWRGYDADCPDKPAH